MCCDGNKQSSGCLCNKICGVIRLIVLGTIIGGVAGIVAMYFFDRNRKLQRNTKEFIKGAENLTCDIRQKINNMLSK